MEPQSRFPPPWRQLLLATLAQADSPAFGAETTTLGSLASRRVQDAFLRPCLILTHREAKLSGGGVFPGWHGQWQCQNVGCVGTQSCCPSHPLSCRSGTLAPPLLPPRVLPRLQLLHCTPSSVTAPSWDLPAALGILCPTRTPCSSWVLDSPSELGAVQNPPGAFLSPESQPHPLQISSSLCP